MITHGIPFPSPEWTAAFKQELDNSAAYKAAGATWTHGPIALVVRADPAVGVAEGVGLWLDLHQGICREARVVSTDEAQKAPFCITGDYARWKEVLRKQLDPIKAMMQKKLELKGQMTTIVKYVNAAKELVEASTRVPTKFVDEK
jgi:putative sterol carrier protein